ncbi:MAG: WYL domain-containing protein [Synergistes sp.]|nr:WYL domain-containing protein [Synergistes sp.]
MIFSELYSAYYNAVAAILKAASTHPLGSGELQEIIEKNAFGESAPYIESAIAEERWQLLRKDGSTAVRNIPTMPLTTLEKRWLKAIYADPRVRLFTDDVPELPDVEPLFKADDITVFDSYADGDPYEDETYIKNFRLILDAVRNRYPLSIHITNRRGGVTHMAIMPEYLEYSEKDDKFRLIGSGCRYGSVVNLGRIVSCGPYRKPFEDKPDDKKPPRTGTVEFELYDKRNALERVLMHFAHFEKQAEKTDEDKYKVTVKYDKDDETEIVIRFLSFGPMVKATAPRHFVELIKERLLRQKSCGR